MDTEAFYIEKRKFVRYGLKAKGKIKLESGPTLEGIFRDISVAGAYLEADGLTEDDVNQFVTMSMQVEIKGQTRTMVATSKIVRVTGNGAGMLFGTMDEESKSTFHSLMQELRDNLIKD